jgi:hypothetical protein
MWIRGVGEHARSRRRWIGIQKQMQVTSLCSLFLSVDASTRSALRLGAVLFRIVYYIPLSILELWIGYTLAICLFGPPAQQGFAVVSASGFVAAAAAGERSPSTNNHRANRAESLVV